MKDYGRLIQAMISRAEDAETLSSALVLAERIEREGLVKVQVSDTETEEVYDPSSYAAGHRYAKQIGEAALRRAAAGGGEPYIRVYKKALLFNARQDFDSYCLYLEWNRAERARFYAPRRRQLLPVVRALQGLEDGEYDLVGISLPPGTGKSTLAIFFLTWTMGKHPELANLVGSHNNDFLKGLYDECLRIMSPGGEYLWDEVFPAVSVTDTDAKGMRINLNEPSRFTTFQACSIKSGNAGRVRATNLLYCDDLVEGIEQAMSKSQLDKLWSQYSVDLRQRKQGDRVKELHIATRWSLHDVIGRLERTHEKDKRALFINVPALDAQGNSNFDYPYGIGFSREMYEDLKANMDDVSWRALYMGQPIEREGTLYAPEELRRYFELPDREPDAILAVVDTKEQGIDYCVMPVAYRYGNDYYIDAFVCDNGKMEAVMPRVEQLLLDRGVHFCRIESNRGGDTIARDIQEGIRKRGGDTRITTRYNNTNKETRIITASPFIKNRFLFRDDSVIEHDRDYKTAMQQLFAYSMSGKNPFDDVPDALTELAGFVRGSIGSAVRVSARPF